MFYLFLPTVIWNKNMCMLKDHCFFSFCRSCNQSYLTRCGIEPFLPPLSSLQANPIEDPNNILENGLWKHACHTFSVKTSSSRLSHPGNCYLKLFLLRNSRAAFWYPFIQGPILQCIRGSPGNVNEWREPFVETEGSGRDCGISQSTRFLEKGSQDTMIEVVIVMWESRSRVTRSSEFSREVRNMELSGKSIHFKIFPILKKHGAAHQHPFSAS